MTPLDADGRTDLLPGTLDLLILQTLQLQPLHGLGVADRLRQLTGGTFSVQPGSLFPALHRLEQDGSIEGTWTSTDRNHRVRSYRLTAAGRRQLAVEKRNWARIVSAMNQVLEPR